MWECCQTRRKAGDETASPALQLGLHGIGARSQTASSLDLCYSQTGSGSLPGRLPETISREDRPSSSISIASAPGFRNAEASQALGPEKLNQADEGLCI